MTKMDVVEFRTGPLATSGDDVRMVIKSCGFAVIVNRETLGRHPGAWLHLVPNEPRDALPIDCLDATKADPAKLFLGIPSTATSTAVLPSAPRPRAPSFSPPTWASSTATRPIRRSRPLRIITLRSFCNHPHAV